jgi:hypothetical protein
MGKTLVEQAGGTLHEECNGQWDGSYLYNETAELGLASGPHLVRIRQKNGGKMKTAGEVTAAGAFVATEREIWTIAGLMLQGFGDKAVIEAAMRANRASLHNDICSQGLWRRVSKAISALTETEAETIH